MLLTWHKNNNFSNLWVDLDFQLEEEEFKKKKIATYIHQIYSNGLLKLKNMDWFIVCALYTYILCMNFMWDIL
jgi:hypothetical protein